jgi:hypothetical protein
MIKRSIIAFIAMVITVASTNRAYSQIPDSTRIKNMRYFVNLLKTDTATARKVMDIQNSYKLALKHVTGNSSLTESQQRSAIDSLIGEKNYKLEQLLPTGQLLLLVPTTEQGRKWKRDTTARTN